MTVTEAIRESAVANGMKVGLGIRLVTYVQLSDGSWSGCWLAQERSLRAARERLAGCRVANITAEIWKNGAPLP